jgi:hypothetical protein
MSSQTSPLEFKRILYVKKGSIAYVRFNRPRVFNALDTALIAIADARSGQRDLSDRLQSQDAQKNRRATLVVRSRLAADWHSS